MKKMTTKAENADNDKNGDTKFVCEDCGYATKVKYNFTNHQDETCKIRRNLGLLKPPTEQCKYCSGMMTHNALRSHLRNLINTLKKNATPKNHPELKLEEVQAYLDEIKKKN